VVGGVGGRAEGMGVGMGGGGARRGGGGPGRQGRLEGSESNGKSPLWTGRRRRTRSLGRKRLGCWFSAVVHCSRERRVGEMVK